jgi:DNA-binding NtrC family response regulator
MGRKLLVVDDDEAGCRLIKAIFTRQGFEVVMAHDGEAGLARAAAETPDVVVLDLQMPGVDGFGVLERMRSTSPATPIVVLTANSEVKSAVRATQLGAFDYLTKPLNHDEIVLVVQRALERRSLEAEVDDLRRQMGEGGGLAVQMGHSQEVRQIIDQVRTVASSNFSVLVLGETGSGKELVAQAIHRQSDRRGKPFIALDCGAIPDTLLESELFGHEKGAFTGALRKKVGQFHLAEGGTLFLDEVGNLPLGLQAKLLRVLESRQVQSVGAPRATPMDVRFVAATNNDLQAHVAEGRFRADLYFRLAQYTIALPALRDRPTDIPYLSQRFLEEASFELRRPVHQIPPDVLTLLQAHPWPGNVRQLRNVVRQAVLESKDLTLHRPLVQRLLGGPTRPQPHAAPASTGKSLKETADEAAREAERHVICETLRATRGNKSQAAKVLRTDYKTLHTRMKLLGIRARDFSP